VEVRLTLSLGKQELIIFRAMKGKGMMPEAFLILDGQRIAAGTKEVDLRLEEILKISYQDFMKTFYARQKDLDNLLKEGGVGKREYLLKLLGLEDIKEQAIEEIKSDRASLEDQKSRLEGALAEVGDVLARLESASICRKKWKRSDRSWRPWPRRGVSTASWRRGQRACRQRSESWMRR
jgi:exonuclease SbcC